jgi:hypothetical protein
VAAWSKVLVCSRWLCWDYVFESCREHGCLYVVSVVCVSECLECLSVIVKPRQ